MRHLLIGAAAAIFTPLAALAACAPDVVQLRGDWGTTQFSVAVADDAAERSQGLMFVEEMPESVGMLFVYEGPKQVAFWMRNTLIPLDMIFIDADGTVGHVHHEAIPGDETAIPGRGLRLAVLEINGGLAKSIGIDAGTQVQHPAFGADAAWPCTD